MRLSTRNKIFVAGVAGAVVLCIGFYLLITDFSAGERALDQQFPLRETDGVPGGFYLAFTGIVLLALSGFMTGALYVALARADKLTSNIPLSMAAGATTGLIIFLLTSLATLSNVLTVGLVNAILAMFTAAFYLAPIFLLIMLLLALFAAVGGTACKLALISIARLRPW